jgi:hypothetical protein
MAEYIKAANDYFGPNAVDTAKTVGALCEKSFRESRGSMRAAQDSVDN